MCNQQCSLQYRTLLTSRKLVVLQALLVFTDYKVECKLLHKSLGANTGTQLRNLSHLTLAKYQTFSSLLKEIIKNKCWEEYLLFINVDQIKEVK